MDESEALDILKNVGAVLDGHFVYKSGKHGRQYVNKDRLFAYTVETMKVARGHWQRSFGITSQLLWLGRRLLVRFSLTRLLTSYAT